MKTIQYKDFPQKVRNFIESYFSNQLQKISNQLSLLHISFEERPQHYPSFIKAEFIPPYKISYYNDTTENLRWDGIIHDTAHFFQYHMDTNEYKKNREVVKTAAFTNFGVYLDSTFEKEAFKAQEEYNKYCSLKFSQNYPKVWINPQGKAYEVEDHTISLINDFGNKISPSLTLQILKANPDSDKFEGLVDKLFDLAYQQGWIRISTDFEEIGIEVNDLSYRTKSFIENYLVKYNVSKDKQILVFLKRTSNPKFEGTVGEFFDFDKYSSKVLSWDLNISAVEEVVKGRKGDIWKVDLGLVRKERYFILNKVLYYPENEYGEKNLIINGEVAENIEDLIRIFHSKTFGHPFTITPEDKIEYVGNIENLEKLSWQMQELPNKSYLEGWVCKIKGKELYGVPFGHTMTFRGTGGVVYFVQLRNTQAEATQVFFEEEKKRQDIVDGDNWEEVYDSYLEGTKDIKKISSDELEPLVLAKDYEVGINFLKQQEMNRLSWEEPKFYEGYKGWLVKDDSFLGVLYGVIQHVNKTIHGDLIGFAHWGKTIEDALQEKGEYWACILSNNEDITPLYKIDLNKQSNQDFDSYKDQNTEMYRNRLNYYNENKGAEIFWSSKDAQEKRFEALLDIGDLTDKEILDVGCGYCDFLDYIEKKDIKIKNYVGVDIVPEIVKKARELHPNINIEVRDIQKDPIEKDSFDYVFGSGIFAIDNPNWNQYTVDMLKGMLLASRVGVGINFLKQQEMNRLSWEEPKFYEGYKGWLVKTIGRGNYTYYGVITNIFVNKEYKLQIDAFWGTSEREAIRFAHHVTALNYRKYIIPNNLEEFAKYFQPIRYIGLEKGSQKKLSWQKVNNLTGWLCKLTDDPPRFTVIKNDNGKGWLKKYYIADSEQRAINNYKNNRTSHNRLPKEAVFPLYQVFKPEPPQKLSWKDPEDLTGWLCKFIPTNGYVVILQPSDNKQFINFGGWIGDGFSSPTEEKALEKAGIYDTEGWTDEEREIIPSHTPYGVSYSEKNLIPIRYVGHQLSKTIKQSSLTQLKYNDPQTVLNLIKQNVTDKTVLKDNYLADDFSIFIFK